MEKSTEERLSECVKVLLLLSEILTQSGMPLCAKLAHDMATESSQIPVLSHLPVSPVDDE